MKKITILGACIALAGCASSEVTTTVTASDAEIEQYQQAVVSKDIPIIALPEEEQLNDWDDVVEQGTAELIDDKVEDVQAETFLEQYSIQVLALRNSEGFDRFITALPDEKPIFVNEKTLNDAPWFTLLYGAFSSREAAKIALDALPADVKRHGPFIRDIDLSNTSEMWQLR
ncbi:SPOR domain-containing protein [Thaumasiovibrio sp. DFM-14]|uniref:SPOR domain-containing protein n=1 Tax=Thaumasiovibrio sp. DFM-14 TaxID=3384792 RepID=UPI0039A2DE28